MAIMQHARASLLHVSKHISGITPVMAFQLCETGFKKFGALVAVAAPFR